MTASPSNVRNVPYLPVKQGVTACAIQRQRQGWVWNEKWFVPSDLPPHQLHPLIFGSDAGSLAPFLQFTHFEKTLAEIKKNLGPALEGYIGRPPFAEQQGDPDPNVAPRWATCDSCGKKADLNIHSGLHSGCNYIYGRRGWRQLGAYDG